MKKQQKLFAAVFLVFLSATAGLAQEQSGIKGAIENKNFVFTATSVSPQRGPVRQLTTEYDLSVNPDSVISYLPYFGRAYTAPLDPAKGGIMFTSTKYNYSVATKRKDRWEIQIRPKDQSDVRDLFLTVYDNGRANLRVNSLNREPISFEGELKPGRERPKKAF